MSVAATWLTFLIVFNPRTARHMPTVAVHETVASCYSLIGWGYRYVRDWWKLDVFKSVSPLAAKNTEWLRTFLCISLQIKLLLILQCIRMHYFKMKKKKQNPRPFNLHPYTPSQTPTSLGASILAPSALHPSPLFFFWQFEHVEWRDLMQFSACSAICLQKHFPILSV